MDNPFPVIELDEIPEQSPEDILGPLPPGLPRPEQPLTSPKHVTGRRMVESVWRAFEVSGGDWALAAWVERNRTKFYCNIFARMLPQGASPIMADNAPRIFKLNTPVKPIDIVDVHPAPQLTQ